MSTPAIHRPNQGETLSVVGETIRILADGAATDGKYLVFENISPVGNGPPLHRHGRDDEFFFVLEGIVKFSIDGQETVVTAGSSVRAPRGSVHAFANVGQAPSRMLILCCPAGLEGPFREIDALTRAGQATPDTIVAAFKRFDLEVLGPPLLANPPHGAWPLSSARPPLLGYVRGALRPSVLYFSSKALSSLTFSGFSS